MDNSNNENKQGNNKALIIILFALVGILGGTTAYFGYQLSQKTVIVETLEKEKATVTDERKAIADSLNMVLAKYDSLFKENENAMTLLSGERQKVADLLKDLSAAKVGSANYKKIKAEADKLRKEQTDLLAQIKRLQDENVDLTAANVTLHKDLVDTKTEKDALDKEVKNLNTTVETGSRLRAYEVVAEGVKVANNGKEKSTEKAKRSNKIRTCFTLLENTIAKNGSRTLYMVVHDPSGQVLTTGGSNTFTAANGETVSYSAKKEVDYDNAKAIDVCMYFGKDNMPKGKYMVSVYCDNYSIGSAMCELK